MRGRACVACWPRPPWLQVFGSGLVSARIGGWLARVSSVISATPCGASPFGRRPNLDRGGVCDGLSRRDRWLDRGGETPEMVV